MRDLLAEKEASKDESICARRVAAAIDRWHVRPTQSIACWLGRLIASRHPTSQHGWKL
jgi:hypothetical protein